MSEIFKSLQTGSKRVVLEWLMGTRGAPSKYQLYFHEFDKRVERFKHGVLGSSCKEFHVQRTDNRVWIENEEIPLRQLLQATFQLAFEAGKDDDKY